MKPATHNAKICVFTVSYKVKAVISISCSKLLMKYLYEYGFEYGFNSSATVPDIADWCTGNDKLSYIL